MSCGGGKANFRLLDPYVGWDATDPTHSNLTGICPPTELSLALVNPGAVDPAQILAYLPPARLARGCGACEWYLITPAPPKSRLLRRDACHPAWGPVWKGSCRPDPFVDAVAVAAWRRWIAVSDLGANEVRIWAGSGATPLAEIPIDQPGPLAFSPRGELLITSANSSQVARYGPDGIARGFLKASLPDRVNRIAVDPTDKVWIVTGTQEPSWKLWSASRDDAAFKTANVDDLAKAFPPTGIVASSDAGFCFEETGSDGLAATSCFSWCGRPLAAGVVSPPSTPQVQKQGQLLTGPLDSGVPRCRWHRVRIDADVPPGTMLSVSVATMEDLSTVDQGDPLRDPNWSSFPAGPPHFSDWTTPTGSLDFLIDQPPGRSLFFRMRFSGNGSATPVVRQVRIDFPRVTSLDHLPAVYRETPKAEDFTERFLALFDASIGDLDGIIERYPALLDPSGVPEQLLPWLGTFFDIGFDSTWNADKRRQILRAAPQLYRQRGTLAGMKNAINLVFGVTPAIDEASATGMWGALGSQQALKAARCNKSAPPASLKRNAKLGSVRLFGKTRSRFRLDRSPLGGAPLRSYGNPDQDPFTAGSYRFNVLVPAIPNMTQQDRDRLTGLIESQKPAHTVASLRVGGTGFLLGSWSAVGVDTSFTPLAAPVLGSAGNVRLNRMSILWNGPGGPDHNTVLGQSFILE
jgi:phage tail-like protein